MDETQARRRIREDELQSQMQGEPGKGDERDTDDVTQGRTKAAIDRLCECKEDAGTAICRTIVEEVREWKMMTHAALPDWLKDNDYLHGNHRPHIPCMRTCFKSVFCMHSETVNIWTHLIGSLIIVAITFAYFVHPDSVTYSWPRILVFVVFFTSAVLCMTFSWMYHTVYCHSVHMKRLFSKLDYSGIALLILGSFVPWLYYNFYCEQHHMVFYTILLIVLSAGCIIFSLYDRFAEADWRSLRAMLFIGLGLSGLIPFLHGVSNYGLERTCFSHMATVAFLYILGAALYALRVPERFLPGKLDVWGHSHQLFHVLVVIAAVVHYQGINIMAEHRKELGECTQ